MVGGELFSRQHEHSGKSVLQSIDCSDGNCANSGNTQPDIVIVSMQMSVGATSLSTCCVETQCDSKLQRQQWNRNMSNLPKGKPHAPLLIIYHLNMHDLKTKTKKKEQARFICDECA